MTKFFKTLLFVLIVLAWNPSLANSAVAKDGTCTQAESANGTNHDVSHTVGASANYLVAFHGIDSDTITSTGATWDFGGSAQAMTEAATNGGTGAVYGAAYVLVSPTAGTLTLRFTTSASATTHVFICDYTGFATLGTIVETESIGSVTGDSLAVTIASGGLAVAFLLGQSVWTNFAQGADQTELFITNGTGCGGNCAAVLTDATISPLNYTWDSDGIDFWHVVLVLNPSSTAKRRPIIVQ